MNYKSNFDNLSSDHKKKFASKYYFCVRAAADEHTKIKRGGIAKSHRIKKIRHILYLYERLSVCMYNRTHMSPASRRLSRLCLSPAEEEEEKRDTPTEIED